MKHPPTTPLRALLGLTALAAIAPETMGPSAAADRRLHSPDTGGSGHGPLHPADLADPTRGMTQAPSDLGGGSGTNIDETAITNDALIQGAEASGVAVTTNQLS